MSVKEKYFSAAEATDKAVLKNCFYKEGRIVSRPGLSALSGEIFTKSDLSVEEMSFIDTDCYLYLDGQYGRITVNVADNLTGNIVYNIRLVCANGRVQDMGCIVFGRVSADQFGVPDSFTLFRGRPTIGCGIYFIARVVYGGGYADRTVIAELSYNKKVWLHLDESYFYVPTVLANGRGEEYYTASPMGEPLSLKKSVSPESRNLINPAFRCCFTADSSSWSFQLAFTQLDDDLISCDFLYGGITYSWRIYAGETRSQPTAVKGTEVVMHCDRNSGRVFFQTAQDVGWAPVYTGELNNLRITARKTDSENTKKVSSMSACKQVSSAVRNGEYDLTVFYKSREFPALMLTNTPDQPLYFPADARISLGESKTAVKHLMFKGKNLLVFKENEIYSAPLDGYEISSAPIVSVEGASKRQNCSFSFKRMAEIHRGINPSSIAAVGDRIYFACETGEIFSASGNTADSFCTEKVCDCDTELVREGFGMRWGEKYLLIEDTKMKVVEKQTKGYSVAEWSFPTRLVGGFSYLDSGLLFGCYQGEGLYRLYPVSLFGNKDIYLTENGQWTKESKKEIEAEYFIPLFEGEPLRKRLYRMRIDCSADKAEVSLCEGERTLMSKRIRPKGGKAENICGFISTSPRLVLRFCGPFTLDGVAVKYGLTTRI